MKHITSILIASILAGCSASPEISQNNLNTLSTNELCQSLGRFNNEGGLILKIYDELKKRAETVDNEKCLALEIKAREDNNNEIKVNRIIRQENRDPSMHSRGRNENILNELNENDSVKSKGKLRNPLPHINNKEFDGNYNYHESYSIHW